VIDDAPVARIRDLRDALAALLAERPARERVVRRLEAVLRETLAHFLRAQRATVDRRHRDVAVEEMIRESALRHRAEPQRMRTRRSSVIARIGPRSRFAM